MEKRANRGINGGVELIRRPSMRGWIRPRWFLALIAITTAAIIFSIHSYRHRLVRSDADMLAFLPSGDATVFFANVAGLRNAGVLSLLTGSKPGSDPEYQAFVRQTHFEYSRDLDAVAGKANGEQVFLVLRGRFDWSKLRDYAVAHGGSCARTCKVPASSAGRWASFFPIQPDVMGLALSTDSSAVTMLRLEARSARPAMRSEPMWVNVSMSVLKNPVDIRQPMRVFAIVLQSADSVILSLALPAGNSGTVFNVQLDAACRNAATADTARYQLQLQTRMLMTELAREHEQPHPSDLTGLLTAGTFQVIDNHVIGTWPVSKELLRTLE